MSKYHSIASWKMFTNKDDEPCLKLEYPNLGEMVKFIKHIEIFLHGRIQRRGYRLEIEGSCSKAVQGINWFVVMEFEEEQDRDLIVPFMHAWLGDR